MATPERLLEFECPQCRTSHYEIDHDARSPFGQHVEYAGRDYSCPHCGRHGAGFKLLRGSPPEFFMQPASMSVDEFAKWLSVYQAAFPDSERLGTVGVSWYPGKSEGHDEQLRKAREIETVNGYWLRLTNGNPRDTRLRVEVQETTETWLARRKGKAPHLVSREVAFARFLLDPIELDGTPAVFAGAELQAIRELIATKTNAARAAWRRYLRLARERQDRWSQRLGFVPPPFPVWSGHGTVERVRSSSVLSFLMSDEWLFELDGEEFRVVPGLRSTKLLQSDTLVARCLSSMSGNALLEASVRTRAGAEHRIEVHIKGTSKVVIQVVVDGQALSDDFV